MDSFNLDPNFDPGFSYSQALNKSLTESSGASVSQHCMSGYSVQTLDSPLPAYVSQSDAVQNNAYSVNPLSQYVVAPATSESNFISTDDLFNFPLDEILGLSSGTNETASDELIYAEPNAHTVTHPPLKESPCEEAFGNYPQPSVRPFAKIRPLNKDYQQDVQIETAGTVSINSGNVVNSLKRPIPVYKGFEVMPQKLAKTWPSTISENRSGTAGFKLTESSASSESVPVTSGDSYYDAYHKAYNDKLKELVSSDIFDQAKAAGQAAGQAASKAAGVGKAYHKAYHKAYNDKLKELVSSDIFYQAKAAGKVAGKAAGAGKAYPKAYNKAYNDKLKELVSSDIFYQAKAAGKAVGKAAEAGKAYHKAYKDKLKELVSSDIFDQSKAAGKAERNRVIESSVSFSGEMLPPLPRFSVVKLKAYLQSRSNPSHPE